MEQLIYCTYPQKHENNSLEKFRATSSLWKFQFLDPNTSDVHHQTVSNRGFQTANFALICSTAFSFNPKAFSNTTSLMPDPNSAAACACTPGFWLFRAAMAVAWPLPTLSSKCRRPLGNTNTSPLFTVVANSWLLVLTNPTNKEPSTTNKISVARGCVWGGTRPPWAKSRRAMEMPRVLRPGNWAANAGVTELPAAFLVLPGMAKPWKTKSFAVTAAGLLHTRPLTWARKLFAPRKMLSRYNGQLVQDSVPSR